MSREAKRVLVVEDASTAARQSAIRALLQSCSFQPGDKLMLLGVLRRLKNRGYTTKMDLSSIFGANRRMIGEELAMKKEEYSNDREISSLSQKCKISQIEFHVEVQAGASPKEVAVRAARDFGATWIILDKHMKKHKAHLMEQLSCRISAVKGNHAVMNLQQSRGTVTPETKLSDINQAPVTSQGNDRFENSACSVCWNRRPDVGWRRNFTCEELQAATEGFSVKNFVAESGSGIVYRGKLNGLHIAAKKIWTASFRQEELTSLVSAISEACHENLVTLLGICSEGNHRVLVYEFICYGSLELHLSKSSRSPLSWNQRMKIALGAARGLHYLHEKKIVHGNLRPSNILLTHDHEARLGDYGLATADNSSLYSKKTSGGLVYFAPEYSEAGKASTQTDCYAFGVVLLRLITGLRIADPVLGGENLVLWARPLLKDRNYPELLDRTIGDSYDVHQLFWIVRVVEKCLSRNPHKRLPMNKVVYTFESLMEGNNTVPVPRNLSLAEPESSLCSSGDCSGSACGGKSSSDRGVDTSSAKLSTITPR